MPPIWRHSATANTPKRVRLGDLTDEQRSWIRSHRESLRPGQMAKELRIHRNTVVAAMQEIAADEAQPMKIHPATARDFAWVELDAEDEAEIEAIAREMRRDVTSLEGRVTERLTDEQIAFLIDLYQPPDDGFTYEGSVLAALTELQERRAQAASSGGGPGVTEAADIRDWLAAAPLRHPGVVVRSTSGGELYVTVDGHEFSIRVLDENRGR